MNQLTYLLMIIVLSTILSTIYLFLINIHKIIKIFLCIIFILIFVYVCYLYNYFIFNFYVIGSILIGVYLSIIVKNSVKKLKQRK